MSLYGIQAGTPAMGGPGAREATRWEALRFRLGGWWYWTIGRRIPRLVWIGQEVDVTITFTQDPLIPIEFDPEKPFGSLFDGELADMRQRLARMGITFDTGQGPGGRDWEWDWSLKGPVNVRFRGAAKHAERRKPKPSPTLAVDNTSNAA